MSAKGPVHFANMYRRNHSLREQVRSHGLRPESKADLCTAWARISRLSGVSPQPPDRR
ncbi:hypothetical protein PMA4326_001340 [Pseudomonas syringae pv. maculicola str. ES4326]|uniref:Uncharacterized protein n=1 Tax=Pseudomonas syringae pv. maculicola str. ES4326 TaxID=629265 RepID=A0A8T8BWB7_PSEYM|nr:hypothetical protein PMA4326_001340 [Pseudomonas syringae pv. maculicola str. ES4326]